MYKLKCATPSDINELMCYLKEYAEKCEHITEMGVRNPTSTYAFLAARPKRLISYDIGRYPEVDLCEELAKAENLDFTFILQDVLLADIEETDMIFIDTWHGELQLKAELKRHADKARKYLLFHDTQTYRFEQEPLYPGVNPAFNNGRGLWYAIEDFLAKGEFEICFQTSINNGLTVLKRIK